MKIEMNSVCWLSLEDLPNEIWKDIKGYENKYQISNYGRVKSLLNVCWYNEKKREKILTIKTTSHYPHIRLMNKGIGKNYLIHRLVAEAFIPNPKKLPQVNHKDENKCNNCVDNLEWCTNKYNVNYGKRKKIVKEKLSIKIEQYDLTYNLIKVWGTMNDAIRYYNNNRHICDVCKGKRKTASGYIWKYSKN